MFNAALYRVTGGSTSQSVREKYRANHPKYRSTQTSFATTTCERLHTLLYTHKLYSLILYFR